MTHLIADYGNILLKAMGQTLLLALYGLFFACIIGVIFGILSVLKSKVCNGIAFVFVYLIRGVPMIVLAYFVYFGVPFFVNDYTSGSLLLSALQAGTICLALNCGAYISEIIRAGIQSVDVGQMEAARSLGLPYWRAMPRVVMPQAIKTMIPSIINQVTSILSIIGFPELINAAKNVNAVEGKVFEIWAIVGVMYLIVISILSIIAKRLERRLNAGRERG